MALVVLLVVALALVAVATLQFHSRHLQQAVADEAQRHAAWLADIDDQEAQRIAADSLGTQDGVLHAGAPVEEMVLAEDSRLWIADYDGESALWALEGDDADTLVVLSLTDAQAAVDAGRRALLLYLGVTLIFITLVGYAFFSFVVIRPLRALGVATERAANGDLASPVKVLPRNEFGEVGRQFNQMLDTLQTQREELKEQLDQIRAAHEELQKTQRSLVRSEKMASVGHLAAGVAHEVGNPLAAVMGYTDLLRDRDLDEETADELADRALKQLKRIREIIRQLLDYSRADSDTEPTAVDVADAIEEAVELVRATPKGREADIEMQIDDDIGDARAIRGELEQVLVNLLLNAVEAMDDADCDERRVTVGCRTEDGDIIIDVIDTGPGIDDEVADEIFDPFFTTRDPGEGTGLGLAITQRLIDRVDGRIEPVDSADGAHFRIELERWEVKSAEIDAV